MSNIFDSIHIIAKEGEICLSHGNYLQVYNYKVHVPILDMSLKKLTSYIKISAQNANNSSVTHKQ